MNPLETLRLKNRIGLLFYDRAVRIWKRNGCPFSFVNLDETFNDSFFDALVEIARGA